jgi:hypothetical protein
MGVSTEFNQLSSTCTQPHVGREPAHLGDELGEVGVALQPRLARLDVKRPQRVVLDGVERLAQDAAAQAAF